MGGFRELAALTNNGVSGAATSEALLPSGQLRSMGKRKRAGAGQLHVRLPCYNSLEGMRSAFEEFDAEAGRLAAELSEREAGVMVREAACCGVQAQLEARSVELAAREGRLADWDARLRSWDAQLQRLSSQLTDQEERVQMMLQPSGRDKENSTPEDTDSDLDVTGGPRNADVHRGGSTWPGAFLGAATWPGAPQAFHRYWETNISAAATSAMLEEQQLHPQLQQPGQTSPTLHIAPLTSGLRIMRSGGDNAAGDAAPAPGSPRAPATGTAVSAESPSECSAGAAAIFPDDAPLGNGSLIFPRHAPEDHQAPHSNGFLGFQQHGQDGRQALPPPVASLPEGRTQQQSFQPPLFHHQQQQGDSKQQLGHSDRACEVPRSRAPAAGQLLESLAQAAEEVERRAGSAAAARPSAPGPAPAPQQGSGAFSKTLDYKSCDHIMCLTKDMARHLFPQPPHSSAGGPTQMSVELEDDSGRLWAMTYRCVPHRYSYELRAGWKNFAAFWAVGVGDRVTLWRELSGRLRISVHASSMHPAPAAGTRGRPGAAA